MHAKLLLCAYMIARAAATEGTVAHAGKVIKTGLGRGEARRIADERNNNAVLYGVCDPSTQRCDVDMLEPFQENKNSSNTSGWSIRAHPVSYRCPAKEPCRDRADSRGCIVYYSSTGRDQVSCGGQIITPTMTIL